MIQLPIVVDVQGLLDQYSSLNEKSVENMLNNLAKGLASAFAAKLIANAEKELGRSRKRYLENIRVIDSGRLEGTVLLDYSKDKFIKMLEEGATAFDMKKGFLNSPKVKIGKKGGRYLTIPFRHATPNALGESSVFAFKLLPEVYKIVKNKEASIPVSGGGSRSAGIALSELPAHLQIRGKRKEIIDNEGNPLFKAYEHKTASAVGIAKYQDPVTGQNSYRSFRRVSEKSDPDAFIHPGIQAHNLVQNTFAQFNAENELGPLLDIELQKLGLL